MMHLRQPLRSKLCGQTCVAMLAGISIKEAIKLFGHRKGTTVAGLSKALVRAGIKNAGCLKIVQDNTVWPLAYIAQVKYPRRRNWHWVLFVDGAMYDPTPDDLRRSDGRINAYLEVYLKN